MISVIILFVYALTKCVFQQVVPESIFQSGIELDVKGGLGTLLKRKMTGIQPLVDFDLVGSSGL